MSNVSFSKSSSGSVAVVIVSESAYGENAIFRESIVLVSSAKTVTALPAVSPRHNARESADTDEGKDIISVFSQVGYEWGDDSNYDGEREAQELLKSME